MRLTRNIIVCTKIFYDDHHIGWMVTGGVGAPAESRGGKYLLPREARQCNHQEIGSTSVAINISSSHSYSLPSTSGGRRSSSGLRLTSRVAPGQGQGDPLEQVPGGLALLLPLLPGQGCSQHLDLPHSHSVETPQSFKGKGDEGKTLLPAALSSTLKQKLCYLKPHRKHIPHFTLVFCIITEYLPPLQSKRSVPRQI